MEAQESENIREVVIKSPIVVHTRNVAKELMRVSRKYDVPVDLLDFNLLDVKTYTRTAEEAQKEYEWTELFDDDIKYYNEEDAILTKDVELKQEYDIEIFEKTEIEPLDSLVASIGANHYVTSVYLTIREGSALSYYDKLKDDMYSYVAKKKLRANILILLFESPLKESIEKFVAKVRVEGDMTFDEKEMLLIAKGIEPIRTINDKLINMQQQKVDLDSIQRVDHSKRGFLMSAVENQVLFVYIKPKMGTPGRSCRGEFLGVNPPIIDNEPKFNLSNKIEMRDLEDKLEFFAKQSGYVVFKDNTYNIENSIDIDEISFKTTGSIDTSLDADITMNIKKSDLYEDAVGHDMQITVKKITVDGSTGPNTQIRSKIATIYGQTHKESFIESDDLKINVHKGEAIAKNAHITRLEHGVIRAETVHVEQALGGVIVAKIITVDMLGSHVKMTASEKIEIKKLQGSENSFIIDPVIKEDSKEVLNRDEDVIRKTNRQIEYIEEEIVRYKKALKDSAELYKSIRSKISQHKSAGEEIPPSLIKRYMQFVNIEKHLKKLDEELAEQKYKIDHLTTKHNAFQERIYDSRVINHDTWHGHNNIIFRILNPEKELTLIPEEGSHIHSFGLEKNNNGTYSIKAYENYDADDGEEIEF